MNNIIYTFNDNLSFNECLNLIQNKYNSNKNLIGGKVLSYDEKNYENGILRKGTKDNFKYYYIKNNKEVTKKDLERINALKIPPMWDYCWISADPNSEIQVIGHDSVGRKQYLYTQAFKDKMVSKRFNNLKLFVELLPQTISILNKHQSIKQPLDKNKVLSTITKIILLTGIRAGKEFYVRTNKSYGITSLRKKHVKLTPPNKITFTFIGKRGIHHTHKITNQDIYNELYILLDRNKTFDKLFVYEDKEDNKLIKIDEFVLNDYLHEYIHPDIVIKDLRTYVVNYSLISNLLKSCKVKEYTEKELKKIVKQAIKDTAEFIQHTPAICKKSYVNPIIINKFMTNYSYFYKNKTKDPYDLLKEILFEQK